MQTITAGAAPARRAWRWRQVLLSVAFLLVVAVLALIGSVPLILTSHLGLSRDLRRVRDGVFKTSNARWERQFELNAGQLAFGLARLAVSRAPVEPEVRTALGAVRGVEVGLYECRSPRSRLDYSQLLGQTDEALASRGWERMVGVQQRDQFVAVYTPRDMRPNGALELCVVVAADGHLILVSARGNLEPVLNLALRESSRHRHAPRFASR